jgi:hypothetical protein
MHLSRRELLGIGALSSAAFFLPVQPLFADAVRNRLLTSQLPKPFQSPLTVPRY